MSRSLLLRLVVFALLVRLASAGLAFLVNLTFPLAQPIQFTVYDHPHPFWDTIARYDSGWYLGIARRGYAFVEGGRSNLAFFPVYPLAMRYVGRALGGRQHDYFQGGLLVSWLASIGATVLFFKLARLDLDDEGAWRAVVLSTLFPFAFFQGVVYSEALFLFLIVGAMLAFRTRHWALAGLAGALAVCTRVNGILALPAMAWLAWRACGPATTERLRAAIALAAVAGGFGIWCAYVYSLSGSPFEWAASIERWGYHPGGAPWTALAGLLRELGTRPYQYLTSEHAAPYDILNGLTALLFVALTPVVWWRLGGAYGLFMLANLLLPLSSSQFEGLGRYCSVLFPAFIGLAALVGPAWHTPLVGAFAALYALCLALFTTLHPLF